MKVFAGLVAAVLGELVAPGEQWNGVPVDQGEEPEFNPLMRTIVKRPATNFCGMTFQVSFFIQKNDLKNSYWWCFIGQYQLQKY